VLCPTCLTHVRRFGRNRNGSQRYRCDACARTFTDTRTRPRDRRCLSTTKAVSCLRLILEGNSVRSTERLTGIHRDTILGAMVDAGEGCERFLTRAVQNVAVEDVQADEIWGFVGCKERTRERNGYSDQGVQYAASAYVERLTNLGVTLSMAAVGEPRQNGFAERLVRTIKEEEVDLSDYQDLADARGQIGHFIDAVYNVKRIHSSLGYLTPAEFEEQWRQARAGPTTTSAERRIGLGWQPTRAATQAPLPMGGQDVPLIDRSAWRPCDKSKPPASAT
jgi:transposase-like protein